MDVGTEFNAQFGKIRGGNASDEGCGAKGSGDAVGPGKLVEIADNVGNQVMDEKTRKAAKRKAVDTGPQTFFHRADRSFNLTDVAVGGDDVEGNRKDVVANAIKFIIGVDVTNVETTGGVCLEDGGKVGKNGAFVAIGDWDSGAVSQVA